MVGTDMSTGAAWASAVLIKGNEDPYIVSSILSWLSELGHSKVIIHQSDGEAASEVVMRMVQSKGAMMEHPLCEIIQQQSQRYSHQSSGGAERMVQTIRNQIKALQNPNREELRNHHHSRQPSTHLVTTTRSMAIHEIPQKTRLNDNSIREDSTHVLPKSNLARWRGSCVQTTRSIGQQTGIRMARRHLART